MSDITMCTNKDCDKRMSCYRFTAEPSEFWQAYARFSEVGCELYWPVEYDWQVREELKPTTEDKISPL